MCTRCVSGAVVQWCSVAVVQWCSGAVVQCCSGAVVQWCSGAAVQWCSGAAVQWCSGAVTPHNLTQTVAVQTEAVQEDELDWDLSDRQDRETQTLPPNPTAFQRNRTDAMVQTDYRYFPLASTDAGRPSSESVLNKTYRDAGTQTEKMTASVSTQTEAEFLLLCPSHPPSAVADAGPAPADTTVSAPGPPSDAHQLHDSNTVVHITPYRGREEVPRDGGRRPSKPDRRSSSVESSSPTTAVAYSPTSLPSLMKQGTISASSSPSLIVPEDVTAPLRAPSDNSSASLRPRKDSMALWESLGPFYLNELLPVVKAGHKFYRKRRKMIDVSVQTEMNAESPEFAPRPPPCRKQELLRGLDLSDWDTHALTTPKQEASSVGRLVEFLCPPQLNDLQKVRVIFRWMTDNIRYDWKYVEKAQTAEQVLQTRAGVSKDFVQLLVALCERASIRVRRLQGFARSREFSIMCPTFCPELPLYHRVGRRFDPERDVLHHWAAVFIFDSWRLLDPTYGAGTGWYHDVVLGGIMMWYWVVVP
ncbi:Transglutaminase-like [Trinorchestia longiramus]|nr:Transglutaminase-like [Trinorchestia longiramus]